MLRAAWAAGHGLVFTTTGGTPGSQYTSIHFTETLILAGLTPSIGTVGDALDNALAETTRRYKTECIRDGSPFRIRPLETVADMEKIASQWVHCTTPAGSCTALADVL